MPRILVAVTPTGGDVDVVNAGRPAVLAAFGDKFGKTSPDSYREIAWLAHRTIVGKGNRPQLDDWLETLDELTANPKDLARAQREVAGRLTAADRLDRMTAAELVELADADGNPPPLEQLIAEAREQLEKERADAERQEAAALAFERLHKMTDDELAALDPEERRTLEQLAEQVEADEVDDEPVPTMPAPAITGASG